MSNRNKINAYTCPNGHTTYSYDLHSGTTPFIIKCSSKSCDEFARSSFYTCSQIDSVLINRIWFKPCKERYNELEKHMKIHVSMGGLDFIKLHEPVTVQDIKAYKEHARLNHKKGDKIKYGSLHPIEILECELINDETEFEIVKYK